MRPAIPLLLLLSAIAAPLRAQCPDGSPPPCGRPAAARAAAPAIDANRIAILPFRVTAADTLLSEGFAELLAAEFSGADGPRAAHMGVVVRAWRQAGGTSRASLAPADAARIARQLGAGRYIDGAIVGLGGNLTITASIVSIGGGETRRAPPIRGSADSLDALMGRLTTTLLALAGGESREGTRGALTTSPAAMRAYLEGMAAWRRYRVPETNAAFERAFREDSTFARAALMRYWTANWSGEPVARQWAITTFALRHRLSSADRLLVQSLLGDRYPEPRMPAASFGDRERAAALLPESPEAQYLAGDWLFHYGGAIEAIDAMERSRGYFARSFALDSQQTVLAHLVDVAVMLADTALLRGLQPSLESQSSDMQASNWLAAGYLGDQAWLARLRAGTGNRGVSMAEAMALLPPAVLEESVQRLFIIPAQRRNYLQVVADWQGRPEAARQLADTGQGNVEAIVGAMTGERDVAEGVAAARRWEALTITQPVAVGRRNCITSIWHEWQRDGAPRVALPTQESLASCTAMAELMLAWRDSAPDLATRLESADSMVRRRMTPALHQGYENVILAKIWEDQGNRRRALSAIRLYPFGAQAYFVAWRLREEGRLAAALGQVDRAIESYRRYLELRKNAEPSLVPQRDSVRVAMARLVRP
jgi:tetratricopeptide (TPR) repeat protein